MVFGSGDWLERLLPGLRKHGLTPDVVVGKSNPSDGQKRLNGMELGLSRYIFHAELQDLPVANEAKALVLSRNADHVPDSQSALSRGIVQTLVEKPLALSLPEARELLSAYEKQGGQLVSSDHYLVKARPLEFLWGRKDVSREDIKAQNGRSLESLFGAIGEIGAITSVDAQLVEGGGDPHGKITGREWLSDPTQGGVFWDLAVHLFAIGTRFNLLENLHARDICARTYDPQSGSWRDVASFGSDPQAELMASVRYINGKGIPIAVTVGKVGQQKDIPLGKYFSIKGEKGIAFLDLQESRVDLSLRTGERAGIILTTTPYELVVRDFKDALDGKRPDNIAEAVKAIGLVEEAKAYYNRSPAVNNVRPVLSP